MQKIKHAQYKIFNFTADETHKWIVENIGSYLDLRKRQNLNFWNRFITVMNDKCLQIMGSKLQDAPLKHGTPFTMDIVNYYLQNSIQRGRDFHVVVAEKEDLRDIDFKMIVDQIALCLDVGGIRHHVARNLIKRVRSD